MNKIAIIGGSGLTQLPGLDLTDQINRGTPWGDPSAAITVGTYKNREVLFLARHGNPHTIPPHKINYRANIWALKESGANEIIAVNTVGGITDQAGPGSFVIPDQLIDYTHNRALTFFEDDFNEIKHIDFTLPYSTSLRRKLIEAAGEFIKVTAEGTYGVTQGPRLETAAEIKRLEHDGCDIVGMTGMPEAGLAKELDIDYACCALVVNWAAGKSDKEITAEIIKDNLKESLGKIQTLLAAVITND